MWPLSAAARAALRTSHGIEIEATAYTTALGVLDIPLSGGTVTADAKSQVRRTATLDVSDPSLWPTSPLAALSPVGSELAVRYGVVVPGRGTEWVPLVRGPIQKVTDKRPRVDALRVEVADRSQGVAEDRLLVPTQTGLAATIPAEIQRLILQSQPSATVIDRSGSTQAAPVIEIDKERWADGIEKLADAGGLEVSADGQGTYIIRPTPTLDDPPVWTVDAGETGVLITAQLEQTRAQVYNGVVATGDRVDGTSPVYAMVTDDDPASPTYWGGPFGKKVRYLSSPLFQTNGQALVAATAMLQRVRGIVANVALETLVNPALEPGDVIEVVLGDGDRQLHIVDQLPVPLSADATQSLTTRSADLPAEA